MRSVGGLEEGEEEGVSFDEVKVGDLIWRNLQHLPEVEVEGTIGEDMVSASFSSPH